MTAMRDAERGTQGHTIDRKPVAVVKVLDERRPDRCPPARDQVRV